MRYVALAEATSFLLLLAASVVKRTGGSELGVHILGPIHGGLFIAYVIIALNLRAELNWPGKTTFGCWSAPWCPSAAMSSTGGLCAEMRRQESVPAQ